MLQFYYHPLSPLARRVWITLLEKQLEFESIVVNLSQGEQLKPQFLQLNPFHHVPVLVDDDLKLIESLAIMDYLEAKYPEPQLLPHDPQQLAKVRMAQMVTDHELGSKVVPLIFHEPQSIEVSQAKRHLKRICQFLAKLLDEDAYFGGEFLSLGDIVTGNGLILIELLNFDLTSFPTLQAYTHRLMERPIWQQTQPNKSQIQDWQKFLQQAYA